MTGIERFSNFATGQLSDYLVVLDKLCLWPRFDVALEEYAGIKEFNINSVLRINADALNDRRMVLDYLWSGLNRWWGDQKCRGELPNIEAWQIICDATNNPPALQEQQPIIDFCVQPRLFGSGIRRLRFKKLTLAELDAGARV